MSMRLFLPRTHKILYTGPIFGGLTDHALTISGDTRCEAITADFVYIISVVTFRGVFGQEYCRVVA